MDYFKFNRDVLSRITRQSDNLRLPFVKLESTKKAFSIMVVAFLMKTCNLLFNRW